MRKNNVRLRLALGLSLGAGRGFHIGVNLYSFGLSSGGESCTVQVRFEHSVGQGLRVRISVTRNALVLGALGAGPHGLLLGRARVEFVTLYVFLSLSLSVCLCVWVVVCVCVSC